MKLQEKNSEQLCMHKRPVKSASISLMLNTVTYQGVQQHFPVLSTVGAESFLPPNPLLFFIHSLGQATVRPSKSLEPPDASWEGPGDWQWRRKLFSTPSQSGSHQRNAIKVRRNLFIQNIPDFHLFGCKKQWFITHILKWEKLRCYWKKNLWYPALLYTT